MADTRGLKRIIQLIFDRTAGRKAEADAKASVGRLDRHFEKLKTTLAGIGKTIIGLFAAREVGRFLRESIREANELDQANRRLAATAKIAGVSLAFLDQTAKNAAGSFRLSREMSADFVIEVSKLTSKAGDINRTADALGAFLDLGAARGLNATQTLTAIRQAILGIDEGTDKLFNKNPSVIYAEFAKQIGTTAGKLTDMQKAQAILNATLEDGAKVRGEYLNWLKTVEGQQFLVQQSLDKFQETVGKSLQPALAKLLPYLVRLIDGMAAIVVWSNKAGLQIEIWAAQANIAVNKVVYGWIGAIGKLGRELHNMGAGIARLFGFDVADQDDSTLEAWVRSRDVYWQKVIDRNRAQLAAMNSKQVEGTTEILKVERQVTGELKKQVQVTRELIDLKMQQSMGKGLIRPFRGPAAEVFVDKPLQIPGFGLHDEQLQRDVFFDLVDMYRDGFQDIENAGRSAAFGLENAFADAFQQMFREGADFNSFMEAIGRGTAAALLQGLAQYAGGKVATNIAEGFENMAKATAAAAMFNPVSAALFAAAAKGHFLSAAKWAVVAGAAGGAAGAIRSGGGSSAGGGVSSGNSNVGSESARSTDPMTEVHIHFAGDIEMTNPKFQRLVYGASQFAEERFGTGARVITHPKRTSG